MPKRVSTEAKIIALFTSLSEESQRMVMFGLNAIAQASAPPKMKKQTPKVIAATKGHKETILPDNPEDFHMSKGAA